MDRYIYCSTRFHLFTPKWFMLKLVHAFSVSFNAALFSLYYWNVTSLAPYNLFLFLSWSLRSANKWRRIALTMISTTTQGVLGHQLYIFRSDFPLLHYSPTFWAKLSSSMLFTGLFGLRNDLSLEGWSIARLSYLCGHFFNDSWLSS